MLLVADAVGLAQQNHLVLAYRPRLPSAGQLHAATQHHIEQVLFEEECASLASRYDTLVYDAAAVKP